MTNDEKLMQQALDALEEIIQGCHEVDDDDECIHKDAKDLARLVKIDCRKLANVLRARLAQGEVSYAGNGTAGRENMTAPTGFFFQMPKQPEPEPEPVAILRLSANAWDGELLVSKSSALPFGTKLYTAPPQREWQGLTYKERCELWNIASKFSPDSVIMHDFAKDIEQALKEKNT